ncbi:hypothetical protein [Tenacibaculum sp. 190524A02b]|uniref:hypothetical protein n=1 Tax=Tenacibaculum vairaonense TaxID=3137860 RepID=UPI0031FAF42D
MKLKSLDSFESLNKQQLSFIVGGGMRTDSELWQDSTSHDCKKKDVGGNSKKQDTAALMAF